MESNTAVGEDMVCLSVEADAYLQFLKSKIESGVSGCPFGTMAHQHIYGFSLFDELHNFLPELLYDDELFSDLPFRWMRARVRTLFPRIAYIRLREDGGPTINGRR